MKVVQVFTHFVHGIANRVVRGRDAMPLQKFFGETLARFQLGGGLCGTESAPAAAREFIDHAKHQRKFRSNHSEIGLDTTSDAR